eukprot:TRINITY_DN6653_c0_g1_i3.p1 TRINITY_DN6653_c0_g1~~TRINITY_DN6653_c0_g1_i3.p1  ORF type:complete len:807 (-),score=108.61 TRINITY_DN6653_c0_g1_i3:386-2767(-)
MTTHQQEQPQLTAQVLVEKNLREFGQRVRNYDPDIDKQPQEFVEIQSKDKWLCVTREKNHHKQLEILSSIQVDNCSRISSPSFDSTLAYIDDNDICPQIDSYCGKSRNILKYEFEQYDLDISCIQEAPCTVVSRIQNQNNGSNQNDVNFYIQSTNINSKGRTCQNTSYQQSACSNDKQSLYLEQQVQEKTQKVQIQHNNYFDRKDDKFDLNRDICQVGSSCWLMKNHVFNENSINEEFERFFSNENSINEEDESLFSSDFGETDNDMQIETQKFKTVENNNVQFVQDESCRSLKVSAGDSGYLNNRNKQSMDSLPIQSSSYGWDSSSDGSYSRWPRLKNSKSCADDDGGGWSEESEEFRACVSCEKKGQFQREGLCWSCFKYCEVELAWWMLYEKYDIVAEDIDQNFEAPRGCAPWVGKAPSASSNQGPTHVSLQVRPEFRDKLQKAEVQKQYLEVILSTVADIIWDSSQLFKGEGSYNFVKWIRRSNLTVASKKSRTQEDERWFLNLGCMWGVFLQPINQEDRAWHPLSTRIECDLKEQQRSKQYVSIFPEYLLKQVQLYESGVFDYNMAEEVVSSQKKGVKRVCSGSRCLLEERSQVTGFSELGEGPIGRILHKLMGKDLQSFLRLGAVNKNFNRLSKQVLQGKFQMRGISRFSEEADSVGKWDGQYREFINDDVPLFFLYEARDLVFGQEVDSALYLPISLSNMPHEQYFVERNSHPLGFQIDVHNLCAQLAKALAKGMPDVFQFKQSLGDVFDQYEDDWPSEDGGYLLEDEGWGTSSVYSDITGETGYL